MKHLLTLEKFTKQYQQKIDVKDFKKIKKGSKILYMGGQVEVLKNDGYVLTLKGKDGKKFTVNKSMFDHGGMIKENLGKTLKKAYMAFKKHFKKSVFSSGPSKRFNIVPPTDADYETAEEWVKANGKKGDMIRMIGVDQVLDKIHINYGKLVNDMGTDVSIDRPEGNDKSPTAYTDVKESVVKDLKKLGDEINYLVDADDDTKKIWKKAGFDTEDDDNVILYSYVSSSWPETKKLLDKKRVKYKELEDPNSAGESYIVFKESFESEVNEDYSQRARNFRVRLRARLEAMKKGEKISYGKLSWTALGNGNFKDSRGRTVPYQDIVQDLKFAVQPDIMRHRGARGDEMIDAYLTFESKVNEARAKKVTKQMWKRMNDDKRFDALLSVVKDPDDAEEYVEYKWEELPSGFEYQMVLFELSSAQDGTKDSDGKHKHEDHLEEDIEDLWKKTYGEKFVNHYPAIAKIIRQRRIKDKREIARVWKDTYGEDFEKEYPALYNKLP